MRSHFRNSMSTVAALILSISIFAGGFLLGSKKNEKENREKIELINSNLNFANIKLDSLKNVPAKIDTVIKIQKVIEWKTDTLILMNKDIYQNTDTIKNELRNFVNENKHER